MVKVSYWNNGEGNEQREVSTDYPLPVAVSTGGGGDNLDTSRTAFGELSVAELTPVVQLQFPYNINSAQVIAFPGNGGSVGNGNDHANVMSGTSSDGFAFILSRDVVKYNTGQGALARFTTIYTPGVADSEQIHGLGSSLDGLFFGYNGADFGVLRRRGGAPEIRTLVVTDASTDDEDITITLDGDVDSTVTVTDSGDVDITAREIAAHNFASLGTGWGAVAAGDTVTFISIDAAPHTGSYAISGSSADGTYAQTAVGVAASDNWTAQTDWNVDKMDGTGPSGMTLDQTKGNVYQIRFQWLGYGALSFSVENAATGVFQEVHRIQYANANTIPSLSNPTLGLFMHAVNKGNTTSLTIKSPSMAGFIEGKEIGLGPAFSASSLDTIGNVTTEEPVLTIRNKQVYQERINRVRITPTFITFVSSMDNTKTTCLFRLYLNATPENGTVYTDISANGSVVEFDSTAVDFDSSVAILQSTFILSATESITFDLADLRNKLGPGTTMMITAEPDKGHANNVVGATINWRELF